MVCSLSEYKGISKRIGLSARWKIDRVSDMGDSYTQGHVRVFGRYTSFCIFTCA